MDGHGHEHEQHEQEFEQEQELNGVDGGADYHMVEPEYDMEFATYGPNAMDIPLSPPHTPPPPVAELPQIVRPVSPMSEATSMTSVDSQDSIGYYREESGRMFPSTPDVPVVLPVDHAEMRRVSYQHDLLRLVTSELLVDRVEAMLDPRHNRSIRVLDVISNSPWLDDMSQDFPHVKFTGCNFVPTRHEYRDNVIIEVYNLNEGIRGKDNYYDVIHCEGCFKNTRDFKPWLRDFKRILKPGGILVMCDIEMAAWMSNGADPWKTIPMICQYTQCVFQSLIAQGIDLSKVPLVGTWLREMGGFSEVEDTTTSIPVGTWDKNWMQEEIGAMARDNILSALLSVSPLWRRQGKTAEEVEQMYMIARQELTSNHEIFERVFCVFARKEGNIEDAPVPSPEEEEAESNRSRSPSPFRARSRSRSAPPLEAASGLPGAVEPPEASTSANTL